MGYVENSWDVPRWLCFARCMTPSRMVHLQFQTGRGIAASARRFWEPKVPGQHGSPRPFYDVSLLAFLSCGGSRKAKA